MKFAPKRDRWLAIVIWCSVLVLIWAGLSPLFVEGHGLNANQRIIILPLISLFCFAIAAFCAWIWLTVDYVMLPSELFIRVGPIKKSIPYDKILKAKALQSWISSTATSSKRIEILYDKSDFIYISPLDRKTFLEELKARCPQAQIDTEVA